MMNSTTFGFSRVQYKLNDFVQLYPAAVVLKYEMSNFGKMERNGQSLGEMGNLWAKWA